MPRVVVMGVSGCGKSTIGRLLADEYGVSFIDGDDLHPAENVAKMRRGEALDDADRLPWLHLVGRQLATLADGGVIACSALRRRYRDVIVGECPDAVFVHLDGSPQTLHDRMQSRGEHFMPVSLLDSQLTTLEPLDSDEAGGRFSASAPPATIVTLAKRLLDAATV